MNIFSSQQGFMKNAGMLLCFFSRRSCVSRHAGATRRPQSRSWLKIRLVCNTSKVTRRSISLRSKNWGKPFFIENKFGALTIIRRSLAVSMNPDQVLARPRKSDKELTKQVIASSTLLGKHMKLENRLELGLDEITSQLDRYNHQLQLHTDLLRGRGTSIQGKEAETAVTSMDHISKVHWKASEGSKENSCSKRRARSEEPQHRKLNKTEKKLLNTMYPGTNWRQRRALSNTLLSLDQSRQTLAIAIRAFVKERFHSRHNSSSINHDKFANKTLPLSPLMNEDFYIARNRNRQQKAPSHAVDLDEFRSALIKNPYAQSLATPLRLCSISGVRLPRFFLQDFNVIADPVTGLPWYMPRSLTSKYKLLKSTSQNEKNAWQNSGLCNRSEEHEIQSASLERGAHVSSAPEDGELDYHATMSTEDSDTAEAGAIDYEVTSAVTEYTYCSTDEAKSSRIQPGISSSRDLAGVNHPGSSRDLESIQNTLSHTGQFFPRHKHDQELAFRSDSCMSSSIPQVVSETSSGEANNNPLPSYTPKVGPSAYTLASHFVVQTLGGYYNKNKINSAKFQPPPFSTQRISNNPLAAKIYHSARIRPDIADFMLELQRRRIAEELHALLRATRAYLGPQYISPLCSWRKRTHRQVAALLILGPNPGTDINPMVGETAESVQQNMLEWTKKQSHLPYALAYDARRLLGDDLLQELRKEFPVFHFEAIMIKRKKTCLSLLMRLWKLHGYLMEFT